MYEKLSKEKRDRLNKGVCLRCGSESQGKKLCSLHMEIQSKSSMAIYAQHKKTIFDHYGNKCNCCGESNIAFLTIDHVDLNLLGEISGAQSYIRIIKAGFPLDIQLLCFNCNLGRRQGICPHKIDGVIEIIGKEYKYKRKDGWIDTSKNIAIRKYRLRRKGE